MVTRGRLERRERRMARAGVDGDGGEPAAELLSGMRHTVQIAPQHLLADVPGSIRSGSRRSLHRLRQPPRFRTFNEHLLASDWAPCYLLFCEEDGAAAHFGGRVSAWTPRPRIFRAAVAAPTLNFFLGLPATH